MNKIVLAVCVLFFIASLQAAPIDHKEESKEKRGIFLTSGGFIRPVVVQQPMVVHQPLLVQQPMVVQKVIQQPLLVQQPVVVNKVVPTIGLGGVQVVNLG